MSQIKNIEEWEILTPDGWQDFDGIKKVTKESALKITFISPSGSEETFICSKSHQILIERNEERSFLFAELLDIEIDKLVCGDLEQTCQIKSIDVVDETIDLYDLVNVKSGFRYVANGLVNHNCAHIENIDDLWLGLYPTLSTGGSAILISTPNGVGNLFHKLYSGAENGENDFHPIELKWDRNPEHTEEWFEEQKKQIIAAKGMRGVAQELMCEFNASGETFLKSEVMMELETFLKDPIKHHHMSHDIWIWEEPQEGKKYVISADIARGDSQDFSAFHIIDTVDDQIVCEYKGKITPDRFADMLYAIGEEYNKALICPELNSFGMVTSNKLKMIGYPNLYYDKYMKNAHMSEFIDENQISDSDQPGILISVKNREFLLANLENVLRNRKISFYSKRLYSELKTFVWKSTGKASAQKGYNDDLIMALSMGAGIYESSGRSNHSQDDKEITMALLAGMSRGTKKLNSDFKTTTVQTNPILPVYTTSQLKEEAEKSSISNDGSNNSGERQISKEEYWNMWDWVSKD